MKWTEKEIENNPPIYIGKYNNYLFQIKKFSRVNPNKGHFVIIEDLKTNNSLNSLWINLSFKKLEDVEKWCKLYAVYNKDIRINKRTRKNWLKQSSK